MASDWYIKEGDTNAAITATLYNANGAVIVLTGATVKIRVRHQLTQQVKINAYCTILSAPGGRVSYTPSAAEVDTPGDYWLEFNITFADTSTLTVPNDREGYVLTINPNLL